jgi:transcriptional regulator with XRE-family HTH domain
VSITHPKFFRVLKEQVRKMSIGRGISGDKQFGQRLKIAIKNAGFTQRQISELLQVSDDTITNYVKGRTKPNAVLAGKLANLLNIDLQWLLTGAIANIEDNQYNKEFSQRLKQLLDAAGYNHTNFAVATGLDQAALDRILQGEVPDAPTLCRIARALHTSVEWLLTGRHPELPAARKETQRAPPAYQARAPDDLHSLIKLMAYIARLDRRTLDHIIKEEIPPERALDPGVIKDLIGGREPPLMVAESRHPYISEEKEAPGKTGSPPHTKHDKPSKGPP